MTDKTEIARQAIDSLFSDTSRAPSSTREELLDLKEHIEVLLDSLPDEDGDGE